MSSVQPQLDATGCKAGIDRVVPWQEHLIPHVEGAEKFPSAFCRWAPYTLTSMSHSASVYFRRHRALETHRLIAEIAVGPFLHLRHVPVLLVVPVVAVVSRAAPRGCSRPGTAPRVQQLQMVVERIGVVRHLI